MTLPGVILLAIALLAMGQAAIGEMRCSDAARAGARVAARGESDADAAAEASRLAPPGARITVSHKGSRVVVSVSSPLRTPTPSWAGLTLQATATADAEGPGP
jgi:hypothetical protein